MELDLGAIGQGEATVRQRSELVCTSSLRPIRYTSEFQQHRLVLEFEDRRVRATLPDGSVHTIPHDGVDAVLENNMIGQQALIVAQLDHAPWRVLDVNRLSPGLFALSPAPDLGPGWWRSARGEELRIEDNGALAVLRDPALQTESVRVHAPPPLPSWLPPREGPSARRVYALIGHPTRPSLLALVGAQRWTLPSWPLEGELSFDALRPALSETLGFDPLVLREVVPDEPTAGALHVALEVVPREPGWSPGPGQRWVEAGELSDLDGPPGLTPLLTRFLAERGDPNRAPGLPWESAEWYRQAGSWAVEQLERLGQTALSPLVGVRSRRRGAVARLRTTDGDYYLKALPEPYAFEPLLLRELGRSFPGELPTVVAHCPDRRWFLSRDFGGTPLAGAVDRGAHAGSLRRFAAIQVSLAPRVSELLALGCPDRRLARLGADVDRLLADPGIALALSADERSALAGARPTIEALGAGLAALDMPASLEHGDLHPRNIRRTERPDGYVYFDLTDASIAPPILSLVGYLQSNRRAPEPLGEAALIAAYAEPWAGRVDAGAIREAARLGEPLCLLHRAVSAFRLTLAASSKGQRIWIADTLRLFLIWYHQGTIARGTEWDTTRSR